MQRTFTGDLLTVKNAGALSWSEVDTREAALIKRCTAGDEVACAELVSEHQRMVFTLALHLLGDRDEALDLSQEVFLRVFRTLATFRGQSALRTWIYRIVINQARNRQRWWRRRYRSSQVSLDGHSFKILHTGAVLTFEDEQILLSERETRLPYGLALWPSAIALAHEIAARANDFGGRHVLELGAGTGLPGIVAASLGAVVVQTDRQQAALHLCRLNAERSAVTRAEHRIADWTKWDDTARYDWIIGADILYAAAMHPHLTRIFESNLAPGGRVLLSDPFRRASLALLDSLESAGWAVTVAKWTVGEEAEPATVGVFELSRPSVHANRGEWVDHRGAPGGNPGR